MKNSICLPDDNKVYSWGNSNSGQLGVGTTETSPHPRPLHLGMSAGTKIRGITCGTRHSFVWTQDGDCFSFGNNYSAQLGYDFRKPDFKENQVMDLYILDGLGCSLKPVIIFPELQRVFEKLFQFMHSVN